MSVYIWSTEITNLYVGIPNPESITLDKNSISLTTVWQTEQLTATLTPTPCDQRIIWTTTNHTVATVSTTGLVTCVNPWTCTITAITANGLTATCSVVQSRLPSAYQEVEYIESSWTQYINTWWTPSNNYCKTVMDATIYTGNPGWIVCYWMTNWSGAYSLHTDHSTRQLNVGSVGNRNTWISFFNWTNWTFTFEANNGSISVDIAGSTYTGSYSWSVFQSTRPFYIFAFDENWSITWKATMRVNSLKIYSDANTIERDLVPCYRIADTEIWMYDLVNNQFYTNSWTGTFTKWNDVN